MLRTVILQVYLPTVNRDNGVHDILETGLPAMVMILAHIIVTYLLCRPVVPLLKANSDSTLLSFLSLTLASDPSLLYNLLLASWNLSHFDSSNTVLTGVCISTSR